MTATVIYHLTPNELRKLKVVCLIARLDWRAMAARPAVARDLIAQVEHVQKQEATR